MQLLTENMSVDELGAEIRRVTPLIRGLVPVVEQEQANRDLRASVRAAVVAEYHELSTLALAGVTNPKVNRFVRNLYTNGSWPSPLPRLMVLELGLTTNKRIKHIQALRLLANRLGCSIFELLHKEREEVARILFPLQHYRTHDYRGYGVRKILYR
jgi:hypothetical protein